MIQAKSLKKKRKRSKKKRTIQSEKITKKLITNKRIHNHTTNTPTAGSKGEIARLLEENGLQSEWTWLCWPQRWFSYLNALIHSSNWLYSFRLTLKMIHLNSFLNWPHFPSFSFGPKFRHNNWPNLTVDSVNHQAQISYVPLHFLMTGGYRLVTVASHSRPNHYMYVHYRTRNWTRFRM